MTVPDLMVLDMELASPVELGRGFLAASMAAGPGCICAAPVGAGRLRWLYADRCNVQDARQWAAWIGAGAGLVTWNGLAFDVPVLDEWWGAGIPEPGLMAWPGCKPAWPQPPDGWRRKLEHIDLYALCALIDAGVPVSDLARIGVDARWQQTWPYDVYRRNRGWNLDQVGEATLGISKLEGMTGEEAPKAWQRGEFEKVRKYCAHDVALTRALYRHAWDGGDLVSGTGRRVSIPRSLLEVEP